MCTKKYNSSYFMFIISTKLNIYQRRPDGQKCKIPDVLRINKNEMLADEYESELKQNMVNFNIKWGAYKHIIGWIYFCIFVFCIFDHMRNMWDIGNNPFAVVCSFMWTPIYMFCVFRSVHENKRKFNKNRVTQLCNFKIKKSYYMTGLLQIHYECALIYTMFGMLFIRYIHIVIWLSPKMIALCIIICDKK